MKMGVSSEMDTSVEGSGGYGSEERRWARKEFWVEQSRARESRGRVVVGKIEILGTCQR